MITKKRMRIYSWTEHYKLYHWNMLDLLEVIEPNTISSIVTDPPYELNFMWKWWDNSWIAFQPDTWKRCLEALKPWWYLLAFGGSRTYHRIACAIEDAGFEIRDCIMWLYGSWFPKSMNIWLAIDKKNWVDNRTGNIKSDWKWTDSGSWCYNMNNWTDSMKKEYEERKATNERAWWWTALKPSYEPIIVARKPLEWSCTDNVIKYWVGGINIDECRVEAQDLEELQKNWTNRKAPAWFNWDKSWIYGSWKTENTSEYKPSGRFPANTILTYWDDDKEEVCWWFPDTKSWSKMSFGSIRKAQPDNTYQLWFTKHENSWQTAPDNYWDSGNASRYFYCAKASKRDRDEWLGTFADSNSMCDRDPSLQSANVPQNRSWKLRKNTHPTVKPCDLMQYLVRLVTPNGWTVLDPFNWSGSTWKAVMYENKDRNKNYKYIWIELTEEYLPIAKARIEYVINKGIEKEKSDPKQEEQTKQRKESALF